jgi:hypothetical protein
MKDSNQMVRYLGYECTKNGGRELQFSLDESKTVLNIPVTIFISATFFAPPGGISFQEAAAICCAKLKHDLLSGTHRLSSEHIDLTTDDVTHFREIPRGRRRA